MAGAGTHLHALIKKYTLQDYSPTCSCKAMVRKMNSHPPQWSIKNTAMICRVMRGELKNRGWWGKLLAALPISEAPMRWMVAEAVRLANKDK